MESRISVMPNYQQICPYCFSTNLGYMDNPIEGEQGLEIEVFCRDCYEDWVEIVEDN